MIVKPMLVSHRSGTSLSMIITSKSGLSRADLSDCHWSSEMMPSYGWRALVSACLTFPLSSRISAPSSSPHLVKSRPSSISSCTSK